MKTDNTPQPEIAPQPDFTIEIARSEDAEQIRHIQAFTWLATYPNAEHGITKEYLLQRLEGENGSDIPRKIEQWRKAIDTADDDHAVYVARSARKVVGFVAPRSSEGHKRFGAIYVLPEAQSRGIGSQLLQKSIDFHGRDEDIYITAVEYNIKALDFYKHHGFVSVGKVPKEDGEPLPLVEMVLPAAK